MVQVVCNSGYTVRVNYHDPKTGGWRTRELSRGETITVIISNGQWIAEGDQEHNDYVFGHGFYTSEIYAEAVQPGFEIQFEQGKKIGTLEDVKVGGASELIITAIDAGFLTDPRNEFEFKDDETAHREYFETIPVSRLVVAQYESLHLNEVMLPTGIKYTSH